LVGGGRRTKDSIGEKGKKARDLVRKDLNTGKKKGFADRMKEKKKKKHSPKVQEGERRGEDSRRNQRAFRSLIQSRKGLIKITGKERGKTVPFPGTEKKGDVDQHRGGPSPPPSYEEDNRYSSPTEKRKGIQSSTNEKGEETGSSHNIFLFRRKEPQKSCPGGAAKLPSSAKRKKRK